MILRSNQSGSVANFDQGRTEPFAEVLNSGSKLCPHQLSSQMIVLFYNLSENQKR